MVHEALSLLGSAIILASATLQLISAIGMIRFPDFYVRLHAATVSAMGGCLLAVSLGSTLVIIGSEGLSGEALLNTARCLLISLVLFVTASTGSHVLSRASYLSGKTLPQKLVVDELKKKLEGGVA